MTTMRLLFLILSLLLTQTAFAARPMVTDDARLTKAGSCQVESWAKAYSDGHEFWALPACNPFGNLELTLGLAQAKQDGAPNTDDYIFQVKTLFRELETNSWSIGLAVGSAQHENKRHPGPNGIGSNYLYIPISHSFLDDKLITHVNLGYMHYKEQSKNSVTWGMGGEYKLKEKLLYILEMYGDHKTNPSLQMGFRYSVIPDIFQIDTTIGQQINKENGEWMSIGIRYTPDKLF